LTFSGQILIIIEPKTYKTAMTETVNLQEGRSEPGMMEAWRRVQMENHS